MTQKEVFMLKSPMDERRLQHHDGEPPKIEKSPFPISEESAREMSDKFMKDFTGSFLKIDKLINSENQEIQRLIGALMLVRLQFGASAEDFGKGAFFAYGIIRNSAIRKGVLIPVLEEGILHAYVAEKQTDGDKDLPIGEVVDREMERIRKIDSVFVTSIERFSSKKHRVKNPSDFHCGAIEVYNVLEKVVGDDNFAATMKGMGFNPNG